MFPCAHLGGIAGPTPTPLPLAASFAAVHASSVLALDSTGQWNTFATNATPATNLGLQVEAAATNLSTTSEGTGAFPSTNNATIAASSALGPTGTTSFYALITSTGNGGYKQQNITVPNDSLTRTRSVHIRKTASAQTCRVLVGLAGGTPPASAFADINLATGAVVGGSTAGAVYDGGDYWRIPVSITNNSTGNTTLFTEVIPVVGGTGSCEAGGMQLEVGSYMTSYAPSGLARSAVTISRTLENSFSVSKGRVRVTGNAAAGLGSGNQVLWQADDGTANNRLIIYRDSSRALHCAVVAGGVTQSDRSLGTVADSAKITVEFGWSGTTTAYSLNGVAPLLEYGVTMPTGLTTERAGCDLSGNQWGGLITAVTHYPGCGFVLPLFGDSFNRADTAAGNLGTPPSGVGYTFYGPYAGGYPLPAATAGQVSSKEFTAPVNSVCYASQNVGQTVTKIGAKVRWSSNGGSSALATPTLIISANSKLIDTMFHLTVNRGSLNVQKRIAGGGFVSMGSIIFSPTLSFGTVYDIQAVIADTTAVVSINGQSVTVTDADLPSIIGPYVGWEQFNNSADMVDLVSFLNVSASA